MRLPAVVLLLPACIGCPTSRGYQPATTVGAGAFAVDVEANAAPPINVGFRPRDRLERVASVGRSTPTS